MRHALVTLTAIAAVSAAAPAFAATILDVQGGGEGCGKTNCFNDKGVFTKTWSSKDAAGPLTIGQIALDRGILGSLDGTTFRLSFQLNGKEVGTWGNYNMAGIGGDVLSFGGEAFTWNPEDGELTLVLTLAVESKGVGGGGSVFRALREPDDAFVPIDDNPDAGAPDDGGPKDLDPPGPQPRGVVTAVPEPASWALMIAGFGLTGATMRRRRPLQA